MAVGMQGVKDRIMAHAQKIDNSIDETDAKTVFILDLLIDRILAYTNRHIYVADFEQDQQDRNPNDPANDEFWNSYTKYPIPPELEKIIAVAFVQILKGFDPMIEGQKEAVRVSDGDQSVEYREKTTKGLASVGDAEVLVELLPIIKKYRVVKVVNNVYE